MTIIDRQNLEKIFAEWEQSMSGNYSEADFVKIGNLTNASHILTGNISKTAKSLMIEFAVTELASGVRKASYPPKPVSLLTIEDLSAVKEATADILRQLGVELTDEGLAELKRTENVTKMQAETMLARGITAQKQGTEVAALSYFFQAAILDPSLAEAVNRSSVMAANISSGNIGADARNDIAWRKAWVARLEEAERYFDNLNKTVSMPHTLFYSDEITQGDIDYQNETMSLTINTNMRSSGSINAWAVSVEQALQAVYNGLEATKRKEAWGLKDWPKQRVTNLNPFTQQSRNFNVAAELVNSKNQVIGRRGFGIGYYWVYSIGKERLGVIVSSDGLKMVSFTNVKANDITDNLTIRFVSVNGEAAETAAKKGVLQIKAASKGEFLESLIEMVFVQGGTFTMGCTANNCGQYEKPAHSVTVRDFQIGKYEFTQALWKSIVDDNPSGFKGDGNLPVERVSWDDVQEFIQKLNEKTNKKYRLPTEAEWEYAARGGNKSKGYKYSGSNNRDEVAWYAGGKTHPVGALPANELGIHDMSGNVSEWVSEPHVFRGGHYEYVGGCNVNYAGYGDGTVVWNRGSIWNKYTTNKSERRTCIGFRLALDP